MLRRAAIFCALTAGLLCCSADAQTTGSATQTLQPSMTAMAVLSLPLTVTLTHSATADFSATSFNGTITMNYKLRTTTGGTITLNATGEFAGTGPKISNSNLKFTCSGASSGTVCSGTQSVQSSNTTVVTFPASSCTGTGCTGTDPQSMSITFSIANDPQFSAGSYSVGLQFTASAV